MYTFGQPRAGDDAFASEYDYKLPHTFRVVYNFDVVPHEPKRVATSHVGKEVRTHATVAQIGLAVVSENTLDNDKVSYAITTSIFRTAALK